MKKQMEHCDLCQRDFPKGIHCGCKPLPVLGINTPEEGGTFTLMQGYLYPYPGIPLSVIPALDDIFKREILTTLQSFPWIVLFPKKFLNLCSEWSLITFSKLKKLLIPEMVFMYRLNPKFVDDMFEESSFKEIRYSKSSRELLRVFKKIGLDNNLALGLVNFWETDNAYRFRGQDVLALADKSNPPRKEIIRLLKIGMERENLRNKLGEGNGVLRKWKLAAFLINLSFFFRTKYAKLIKEFLKEVNVEEIRPTKEDWYWMLERTDYDFGGKKVEERWQEYLEINKDLPEEIAAPPQAVVGIQPNRWFYGLTKENAAMLLDNASKELMKGFEEQKIKLNV